MNTKRRMSISWFLAFIILAVIAFASNASAGPGSQPPLTQHLEEDDDADSTFHRFGATSFFRMGGEGGIGAELLLDGRFPSTNGIGVFVGVGGIPTAHGRLETIAHLAFRVRTIRPLDIILHAGVDEYLLPAFSTFMNATLHVATFAPLGPAFLLSMSSFPISWGSLNHGQYALDVALGFRIRLPTHTTTLLAMAQVSLPNITRVDCDHPTENFEWSLGPLILIEQILR